MDTTKILQLKLTKESLVPFEILEDYKIVLVNKENYNNFFMNNHKIKPTKIENGDIKILIDPMTEMLLLGTTIDYVSENFEKGIFENKFIFTADKTVASSCGCGISFNPK